MPRIFVDAIKKQALSSEDEIYGWLIGYVKENTPAILAIIECKQFVHQSLISAVPQTQEFQEISSIMPQGIGPVGIYHSHPFNGKVFHSHTDDSTLVSLSNQFPNCVSLVTNGRDINFYQMGKNSITKKIIIEYIEPSIPKFILVSMDETIKIKVNEEIIQKKVNIKIKIMNLLRNYLERIWADLIILFKGKQISKDQAISNYLSMTLEDDSIELKVPESDKKTVILDNNNDTTEEILSLNLKLKVPIYISNENIQFEKLYEILKAELVSNNILQKIFKCRIDYDKK